MADFFFHSFDPVLLGALTESNQTYILVARTSCSDFKLPYIILHSTKLYGWLDHLIRQHTKSFNYNQHSMAAVDLGPSTTDLIDEDDQPLPGGDELDSADDATADLEQINENGDAGSDQGLFGDEDDEALDDQPKRRTLDDEELDSGDDADRNDRQLDDQQDELDDQEIELNREGAQIATHALPHGDDGEVSRLPDSQRTFITNHRIAIRF